MATNSIDSSKIRTLSALKYIQYVILILVGILFAGYHLTLVDDQPAFFRVTTIILGAVFIFFGSLSLIIGYIVDKSPFSQNVVLGVAFITIALVCILKPELIYSVFTIVTLISLYGYAGLLFIHIFYLIASRNKRRGTGALVVFSLLGSGICTGLAVLYFKIKENPIIPDEYEGIAKGDRTIGIIIGFFVILIGFISIIATAKRAKNTKILFTPAAEKQKNNQQHQQAQQKKEETYYTKTNFSYTNNHNRHASQNNTNTGSFKYDSPKKDNFASSFGFSGSKTQTSSFSQQQTKTPPKEEEPEIIDIRPKN